MNIQRRNERGAFLVSRAALLMNCGRGASFDTCDPPHLHIGRMQMTAPASGIPSKFAIQILIDFSPSLSKRFFHVRLPFLGSGNKTLRHVTGFYRVSFFLGGVGGAEIVETCCQLLHLRFFFKGNVSELFSISLLITVFFELFQ